MRKISQVFIAVFCTFVVTTGVITYGWNGIKNLVVTQKL